MSMRRGFTILELLVVIAIIVILAALTIPAFNSIGRGTSLSGGGQSLVGALELAHQTAVSQNRPVEVRLYKLPGYTDAATATPSVYRAMQAFLVDDASTNAVGRMVKLSAPIIIANSGTASSLMNDTSLPEQPAVAGAPLPDVGANYKYRSFHFKPDGGTDLPMDAQWYLTILAQNDPLAGNGLPKNYLTIQIDPLTGRTKTFQP
ncbi:hypothetical protein BH09VER1_BH09VER1_22930 [soil metagenome]